MLPTQIASNAATAVKMLQVRKPGTVCIYTWSTSILLMYQPLTTATSAVSLLIAPLQVCHSQRMEYKVLVITADKGFVKSWDLRKHKACHSSDKPFRCDTCGDAFKFKINLDHHGILRHGMGSEQQRCLHALRYIRLFSLAFLDCFMLQLSVNLCLKHLLQLEIICSFRLKLIRRIRSRPPPSLRDDLPWLFCQLCTYKTKVRSKLLQHSKIHKGIKDIQ